MFPMRTSQLAKSFKESTSLINHNKIYKDCFASLAWRTVDNIHLSSNTGEQWTQSIPVAFENIAEQTVNDLRRLRWFMVLKQGLHIVVYAGHCV